MSKTLGFKRQIIVILIFITIVTCLISMKKLQLFRYPMQKYLNISHKDHTFIKSILGMHIKINGSEEFGEVLQQLIRNHTMGVNEKPSNMTINITTPEQNTKKPDEIRETVCEKCFTHDFKYLINNEKICKINSDNNDTIDLFIMILTVHKNFEQRDVIRRTWLSYSKNNTGNVRYAFLLGKPANDDLHEKVVQENNVYHDIIKEDFVDTYMNLTYKTIMGFKWVVTFCPKAKYILKTDDDMYINVPNFVNYVNTSGVELENHVVGSCEKIASPIRNTDSKWYASKESYKERRFPGYCSGTGYITSFNIVNKIFAISPKIPFFHLEDIYVGLCLRKIGGSVKNKGGFNRGRVKLNACVYKGKTMFTSHQVTAKQMETIWNSKCQS
ncbi:beta-1,3-galactosyltransferase 1-like [Ruditapes philippinarum]|uniref:beta-1,3-galactosyltransferase 1-like n=1 Tax=Ruditapes philippinarum TaxID=129788 RepID=UPI00295AA40D|nr:beta-1,3-galactosyltransferase 1-like [Ruditapes philippinarum]